MVKITKVKEYENKIRELERLNGQLRINVDSLKEYQSYYLLELKLRGAGK